MGSRLVGVIVERTIVFGRSKFSILDVLPRSPAEAYDLNKGDEIVAVDQRKFGSEDDLESSLVRFERTHKPFNLIIRRTGKGASNYQFNPPRTEPPAGAAIDPPISE